MGQRARSLGLAGIMLLSVLAGMLMFDLDGSSEEPVNLTPSIDGDSGITLQAGKDKTVTLIVSDEDLGPSNWRSSSTVRRPRHTPSAKPARSG